MEGLILALIVSVLLNLLMFVPAFFFKTDKLTDISYALTFLLLACLFFFKGNTNFSRILVLIMIILWSFRLGTYLLIRIIKFKKDKRFDEFRHKFLSFLGFWVLQAITVFVVSIPFIFYFESTSTKVYYLGIAVWLAGLIIEAVADYQKFMFISEKNNKNKWIESGLWKYSRHPNYFGEILCWIGLWITVLPSLTLAQRIISAVSPLFISVLLLFVSGVPILERKAKEKWGHDHRYEDYVKRTSLLILWPVNEQNNQGKKVKK